MTVMNMVCGIIIPPTQRGSSPTTISASLIPKTSLWLLGVTLTHTLEVPSKMKVTPGCTSACGSTRYMVDGFCSGVGCCEVDIPIALRNITISSFSFKNHTEVRSFNPCGYAFISKKGVFNFTVGSLSSLRDTKMMPMVLDWAIGTESCNEDAENRCGGNSTCYNSDDGSGYRCKCKDGYHGNPYLPHGCQGIIYIIFYIKKLCFYEKKLNHFYIIKSFYTYAIYYLFIYGKLPINTKV